MNTEKGINNARKSNIELFRIIVMFLIVAHHYVVNSGILGPAFLEPYSKSTLFLLLLGAWGKTGINCFVLITGYFMCTSKISLKKFLKLFLSVEFYTILFYFIFLLGDYYSFSFRHFVAVVIPFSSVQTNFIGCYLLFYLIIPFLNTLLNNITKQEHRILLLLGFVIYVLIGTLPFGGTVLNYVSWFIVLYFFGAYIRLHPEKIFNNNKIWILGGYC